MSTRSGFQAAKFFIGLIYREEPQAEAACAGLSPLLGEIGLRSPAVPFAATDYYRGEMGAPLLRRFVAFRDRLPPERLPEVKIAAMGLEERLAVGARRTVNIDPGYLSAANVVIATAKNHYHRVPLRDGVYAHLEYVLKDGRLQYLPWTHPDFKSEAYIDFFNHLREQFRSELKAGRD
jgi:hypothetical protein